MKVKLGSRDLTLAGPDHTGLQAVAHRIPPCMKRSAARAADHHRVVIRELQRARSQSVDRRRLDNRVLPREHRQVADAEVLRSAAPLAKF